MLSERQTQAEESGGCGTTGQDLAGNSNISDDDDDDDYYEHDSLQVDDHIQENSAKVIQLPAPTKMIPPTKRTRRSSR